MMIAKLKENEGIVFLSALALMLIAFCLGGTMMVLARTQTLIFSKQLDDLRAFYTAEAGWNHALAEIRSGFDEKGDGLGVVVSKDLYDAKGMIYSTQTYKRDNGHTLIVSQGQAGESKKKNFAANAKTFLPGPLAAGGDIAFDSSILRVTGDVFARGSIDDSCGECIFDDKLEEHNTEFILPDHDINAYRRSLPSVQIFEGDQIFDLGKQNLAGNYFINGSLTIKGDLSRTTGLMITRASSKTRKILYANFFVTGDVTFEGLSGTEKFIGSAKNPFVVSGGDIYFKGLASYSEAITFDGHIYAKGTIQISDSSLIFSNSSLIAEKDIIFNNSFVSIAFDPGMDFEFLPNEPIQYVGLHQWGVFSGKTEEENFVRMWINAE